MGDDAKVPSFSIVIEWDNARLSEAKRARAMLTELHGQLVDLQPRVDRVPELIILFDPAEVEDGLVEQVVGEVRPPEDWPVRMEIIEVAGLPYYEQKNFGARQCSGEILVFLDSDVIPEKHWLERLLGSFDDPNVAVVGGNAYIEHDDLYGTAFALFWFFPLRANDGELQRARYFFANNVAFKREVFLDRPFPDGATFRGHCRALAESLERDGVRVFRRADARVSHPAPEGGLYTRALCAAHDDVFWARRRGRWRASPIGAVWRFAGGLLRAGGRTLRYGRSVGLNPISGVAALCIGSAYYGVKFFGEVIAWLHPEAVRRRVTM